MPPQCFVALQTHLSFVYGSSVQVIRVQEGAIARLSGLREGRISNLVRFADGTKGVIVDLEQ